MNKILFSSITMVMLSISVFGQIPNFSFENWTNNGTYDEPDNWSTLNSTTSVNSIYTATKGTPGNPGLSYLKLTSKTINGSVVNAIATCSFPFSEQPKSFVGNYQFMSLYPGTINATLTKWNNQSNKRDTVGYIKQLLAGMEMSWAPFSLNFTYLNSIIPDSCIISFKASGSTPRANDYIWVDNLSFSSNVSGLLKLNEVKSVFSISPNPTSDFIELNLTELQANSSKIELIDMNGTTLVSKVIDPLILNHTIDIRNLSKGNYIVRLISDSYSEEKKLFIE